MTGTRSLIGASETGSVQSMGKLGGRGAMLGTNLFLSHLFPLSINPKTVKAVYDAKKITDIKHFISKNCTSISSKQKMRRIVMESRGDGQEMDVMGGISWEGCDGVRDVMDGLMNMAALEFAIRPHSYQASVIIRVLHKVSFGKNYVILGLV